MEFKIDTKDTFTTIIPLEKNLSAKMTGDLLDKCEEMRQRGSNNFVIDLQHCSEMEPEAIDGLVALHEDCYGNDQSLVFTAINENIMSLLKSNESDLLLNIAPKMEEAIDIISMEILERDLLSEE